MSPRPAAAFAAACVLTSFCGSAAESPLGFAQFENRRDPPAYRDLSGSTLEAYALGHAIFNTQFVAAGTAQAKRRAGLGPLFNSASRDSCHNEGARPRAALGNGVAPGVLVLQLDADPVYGNALNSAALPPLLPEGVVMIQYRERSGRYPDGDPWSLREPAYWIDALRYGPMARATTLKPRMPPALFGAGLLEQVASEVVERTRRTQPRSIRGVMPRGRFGWQADATSLEDQTVRALARDMGLTSASNLTDDCTVHQPDCRAAAGAGAPPEVSREFLQALLVFQSALAVPRPRARVASGKGESLFRNAGCAGCHLPGLSLAANAKSDWIEAYTDLLLHDLGSALADRDVAGRAVRSIWRTAPLWGLSHQLERGVPLALLHDGRARSVEEAILWHEGQASTARRRFMRLQAAERRELLDWVQNL